MRVQFWLNVNIENAMTRLRPTCACCWVRNITFNAVTNGTNTHTHTHTHTQTHTHTHTHTNHNQFVSTSKIEYQIIDFAIFGDRNIVIKEQDKYQVLIIELQKVWNVKVVVIPVVIGALGENR